MQIRRHIKTVLLSAAMFILILDSSTAMKHAQAGIDLCLQTLIPSIFPMSILTVILTTELSGSMNPLFKSVGSICRLPKGAESIFLTGLLGGYPLGARNATLAFNNNSISKNQAQRMLSFCSNAGPAFIFGMCSPHFSEMTTVWAIWSIQISSAMCVATLIPAPESDPIQVERKEITISSAVTSAVKAMSVICGWVILFKVISGFLESWILFAIPAQTVCLLKCLIELTNGIASLSSVGSESLRFIICNVGLTFGGLCILMQTASVTNPLSIKSYITGKFFQSIIAVLLSIFSIPLLLGSFQKHLKWLTIIFIVIFPLIFKKIVEFLSSIIYNTTKRSRGNRYAVSKKDGSTL